MRPVETAAAPLPPRQPVRPPSLRAQWQDLRSRPADAFGVVHNLVPVVGVFAFGWSVPLVVFTFWFDGLAALLALITAMLPRALRESGAVAGRSLPWTVVFVVFTWLVLAFVVCLPYWVALLPLQPYLLSRELWGELRGSPALWATFGAIAAGHLFTAFRRGYDELPDRELKQKLRWDAYLLILRAIAMFAVTAIAPWLLVPLLALVLSYIEVWPTHALGLVWGDPSRLHEDDTPRTTGPPPRRKRRLPP